MPTPKDQNGIPGLVYIVVDRDGRHVFAYVSGKRGSGQLEDMTLDTTFWIASCTKLVTTIAAMQLVESGKVRLDREEDIQLILPELSRISVVEEGADGALKLVDQQRKITLRMLLTHTGEGCPIPFLSSLDASTSHSSAFCQNLGYFLAKLTLCAHRSRVRIQLL